MSKKTLADIPLNRVHQTQQKAILRMHLYVTGETHRMLSETAAKMKVAVVGAAKADGTLDGLGLQRAQRTLTREWNAFFAEWKPWIEDLRTQAASIPFGTLVVYQQKMLKPALKTLTPDPSPIGEGKKSTIDFVFNPQLEAIRAAADKRIYSDGLRLSQRIWNLNTEALRGIEQTLDTGVANGMSAWDIAAELEQYLGAGQDCPRWTSTRLKSLTKSDIAGGDTTGLKSGDACAGQGVAYKALRLARNEIQAIHHAASDAVMQAMPWVEKEQIVLSPSHPIEDECDDVVAEGEGGEGIYPVGTIELPIHVQCSPAGQMVTTRDGLKAIESVREGDEVLTHTGRYCAVTAQIKRQHAGQMVRIKTASGQVLTLTPNHPVLVNGSWKPIEKVKVGERVAAFQ